MYELGELLTKLRGNLSLREVAKRSGLSYSYISSLEKGKHPKTGAPINPTPETLKSLSKVYNYDYNKLMKMAGYIEGEQNLPLGAVPYEPDNMLKLPILGTVRAGEPILMTNYTEGFELVEPELLRGRKGFVLRVKGNSMTGDRIYEGDLVLVICQDEVEASEIAVVSVDGDDATLKRVKCQGGVCVLSSSNPEFEPYIFPSSDVHIIGKVVRVIRDL